MAPLVKFGSYGFMALIISAQMMMFSPAAKADAGRAALDAKKSGRSFKRDVKKTARKATGQSNAWDDTKDEVRDAAENAKDEVKHQNKKAKSR